MLRRDPTSAFGFRLLKARLEAGLRIFLKTGPIVDGFPGIEQAPA